MKKLVTNINGGLPLTLDDYRWGIDNGITKTLIDVLGNKGNCIIQGCEYTFSISNLLTVSSGIVLLNGEIYQFDGGTIQFTYPTFNVKYVKFIADTSDFDVTGDKTTRSGTSVQTYEIKKCILSTDGNVSNSFCHVLIPDITRLDFYLDLDIKSEWKLIDVSETHNSTVTTDPLMYRIKGDTVELRGSVKVDTGFSLSVIIPTDIRPSITKYLNLINNTVSSCEPNVAIAPDGSPYKIYIPGSSPIGQDGIFIFDNVSYQL